MIVVQNPTRVTWWLYSSTESYKAFYRVTSIFISRDHKSFLIRTTADKIKTNYLNLLVYLKKYLKDGLFIKLGWCNRENNFKLVTHYQGRYIRCLQKYGSSACSLSNSLRPETVWVLLPNKLWVLILTERYVDGTDHSSQRVLNSLPDLPGYQGASLLL